VEFIISSFEYREKDATLSITFTSIEHLLFLCIERKMQHYQLLLEKPETSRIIWISVIITPPIVPLRVTPAFGRLEINYFYLFSRTSIILDGERYKYTILEFYISSSLEHLLFFLWMDRKMQHYQLLLEKPETSRINWISVIITPSIVPLRDTPAFSRLEINYFYLFSRTSIIFVDGERQK
jgi:hypothetical protein